MLGWAELRIGLLMWCSGGGKDLVHEEVSE